MRNVFVNWLSLLWLLGFVVGCQAETPTATPPPISAPAHAVTITQSIVISPAIALAQADAHPPVRLVIPATNFSAAVTPMAWQVTEVAGERRAVWQVPVEGAGWHINSAGAGGAGNIIISGHHRLGAAVFAPLARGQVKVGQQIILTDDQGQRFAYTVTTISEPVLALGATTTDQAQAHRYLAPSTQPQLTLVTGWPDFSDTHQIFIVAGFTGVLEPG